MKNLHYDSDRQVYFALIDFAPFMSVGEVSFNPDEKLPYRYYDIKTRKVRETLWMGRAEFFDKVKRGYITAVTDQSILAEMLLLEVL